MSTPMKLTKYDFSLVYNMAHAKDAIECTDRVCGVVGGGEVVLGTPITKEVDGKQYTVISTMVNGHIMYYVEKL